MRNIDGKFSTDGARIFNTVSSEEIPADEPLFLLRARDGAAGIAIQGYLDACQDMNCNDLHLTGIRLTLRKFLSFAYEYPERMKQPGVTRHLKLENGNAQLGQGPQEPSKQG